MTDRGQLRRTSRSLIDNARWTMIDEQNEATPESTSSTPPHFPADIPIARPIVQSDALVDLPTDPMLLLPLSKKSAWADMGLVLLFLLVSEFVTGWVGGWYFSVDIHDDTAMADFGRRMLIPTIIVRTIVVLISVPWLTRRRHLFVAANGLTLRNFPANVLLGVGTTMVAYAMLMVWLITCSIFWPQLIEQMQENAGRIMNLMPKQHPLVFVPIALLIGVYEEVLFRGFLMTRLRRVSGSWVVAVLVTTALFTLPHMPDQTTPAVVLVAMLGFIFSIVTVWRRSLVPAIVGHMLFDLSQFLSLYYSAGDSWQ